MDEQPVARTYEQTYPWTIGVSLALLVLVTLTTPILIFRMVVGGDRLFWAGSLLIIGWFWFNVLLRMAYRIDVNGDGIEFRTLRRNHHATFGSISALGTESKGYATVTYGEGQRVHIVGQLRGWDEFVSDVRTVNPEAKIGRVGNLRGQETLERCLVALGVSAGVLGFVLSGAVWFWIGVAGVTFAVLVLNRREWTRDIRSLVKRR